MKKILIISVLMITPSLASAASLSLSPSSQSVQTGGTFTVAVRLDTQGVSIDGVDLKYLSYNPALLQVVDANPAVAGVQIAPGNLMPSTLLNKADNSLGRISFSQIVIGGTKYSGSGTLATITFKAIAPGTANVSFSYAPNSTTDTNVASLGKDVLNAVVNGAFSISGSAVPGVQVQPPSVEPTSVSRPSIPYISPTNPDEALDLPEGKFVPLPEVTPEESLGEQSSSSVSNLVRYIISRIKSGFLKIFGLSA